MNKLCALAAALLVAQAGNGLAQEQQSFKTIMGNEQGSGERAQFVHASLLDSV